MMPLISALIKAVQVQLVATVCQHIAKSIGGNSSKMHLAVDAHGNPIEFIVGDGVTHDIKIAPALLGLELLSNLVYGIQAAFSVDCSSSCLPSLKMTLLTTKVNKLNP